MSRHTRTDFQVNDDELVKSTKFLATPGSARGTVCIEYRLCDRCVTEVSIQKAYFHADRDAAAEAAGGQSRVMGTRAVV